MPLTTLGTVRHDGAVILLLRNAIECPGCHRAMLLVINPAPNVFLCSSCARK